MPDPVSGRHPYRGKDLISPRAQLVVALIAFAAMGVVLLSTRPFSFWRPHVVSVDPFSPGAGYQFVVPQEARDGVVLIRRYALREFRVGKGIVANPAIYQRLVGSAYPAQVRPGSVHLIEFTDRLDTTRCKPVTTLGKMVYARCER